MVDDYIVSYKLYDTVKDLKEHNDNYELKRKNVSILTTDYSSAGSARAKFLRGLDKSMKKRVAIVRVIL